MILTVVEVRPTPKLEQNLIRQLISDLYNHIQSVLNDHINSHLSRLSKLGSKRTINVKYSLDKLLNQDRATLYKTDGTIIPLHQAESNIEIETYNHLN